MVHLFRRFHVDAEPAASIEYLSDFTNTEEWDPGTVRTTRTDSGAIRVGSRWHNVSKLIAIPTELDYELTALTDSRVEFTGRNKTATSIDRIDVVPAPGGGSEVTYEATVTLNGLARLGEPLMYGIFLKLAADTVKQVTIALNRLARGSS